MKNFDPLVRQVVLMFFKKIQNVSSISMCFHAPLPGSSLFSLFQAILSSGTLNSPQILLLSGIGPKQTLDKFNIPVVKDLPGVGQNLHNHVGVELDFTLTKEPDVPELTWESAMYYLLNRAGPLSSTGLSQVSLFYYY